ncbi:MAG: ArsR family transcriptional regulator [Anaerolineales bacterium]|nr:ArsR family transcriptional regulator [Anaerolineales bacterium]MCA9929265.1 ArsR family transcriptional regulator [Anaerolineales bacterium]
MNSVISKEKQSTRETILYTLKMNQEAKVEELAKAAGISPVTVRHHLNGLQADGLVMVSSVRRKVGRPYYVYSLSEQGHELFPKKYFSLTNRLLDEMKEQLPADLISSLFNGVVRKIIAEHQGDFETLPFEKKLDYLIKLLANEGFLADWEKTSDGYRLIEYSCPYLLMGRQHAEVCGLDKNLMISVLGTHVQQHSCMLNGDDCCQFIVTQEKVAN